jgi:DNA helicase IV
MALRMLARRSISGSMTLVGDLGQATSPLAASSWDDVLSMLPSRRPPRVTNLTVNYRTPAEVMDVALEVLRDAGVSGVDPPRSVRSTGQRPVVRSAPASSLSATVAATAADEARAVDGGTVGVIAPEALLASLSGALDDAGVDWRDPDRDGLGGPVTLLSLLSAKGLEFDSVVVVEPADLVAESPQGVRALFVALTRTTGRLVVVHARPLPVGLARAAGRRSPV